MAKCGLILSTLLTASPLATTAAAENDPLVEYIGFSATDTAFNTANFTFRASNRYCAAANNFPMDIRVRFPNRAPSRTATNQAIQIDIRNGSDQTLGVDTYELAEYEGVAGRIPVIPRYRWGQLKHVVSFRTYWPRATFRVQGPLGLSTFLALTPAVNSVYVPEEPRCTGNRTTTYMYVRAPHNVANSAPHVLERLYRAYFLRSSDVAGMDYWVGEHLENRRSMAWISDHFAGSPEFRQLYGDLSNRAFVFRVYQNVLGRNPDTAGLNYWTSQLNTNAKTRGQVMLDFSYSPEFIRRTGIS